MSLHRGLPGVVEAHDVGVLEALEHLHLLAEALALHFGQFACLRRKTSEKKDSDSERETRNKDTEGCNRWTKKMGGGGSKNFD